MDKLLLLEVPIVEYDFGTANGSLCNDGVFEVTCLKGVLNEDL